MLPRGDRNCASEPDPLLENAGDHEPRAALDMHGATRRERCSAKSATGSTGGFDSVNLKEAKALLDELSA
jgi:hypothetical protein